MLEYRTRQNFPNALVLPNCVPSKLVSDLTVKEQKIDGTIRFIFVGRNGREYGLCKIEPLLDALRSIDYEPQLSVVGHNQEGVPKSAVYAGSLSRKDTLEAIAQSDVGVGPMFPTVAIPKKIVEYMALGKVVVAGENALSKDVLRRYGDFIVEVAENDDMAQVADRLLVKLTKTCVPRDFSDFYCETRMLKIIWRARKRKTTAKCP